MTGTLYVLATPIGHLHDLSRRALEILGRVDLIAAEDTRHCRGLLNHYSITTPTVSLHDHNERDRTPTLIERLKQGEEIALVSDAGTPLISDPGFVLVQAAHRAGVTVSPVPGPCAAIAALSAAGLPTDRFAFEGFPPRTSSARQSFFRRLLREPRTLVFYESSHRIMACLRDLATVFPGDRRLVIAKELTKIHERLIPTRVGEAQEALDDPQLQKGEFVLVLEGAGAEAHDRLTEEQRRILQLLLQECSLKSAVSLAEKITGARKKLLYEEALHRKAK